MKALRSNRLSVDNKWRRIRWNPMKQRRWPTKNCTRRRSDTDRYNEYAEGPNEWMKKTFKTTKEEESVPSKTARRPHEAIKSDEWTRRSRDSASKTFFSLSLQDVPTHPTVDPTIDDKAHKKNERSNEPPLRMKKKRQDDDTGRYNEFLKPNSATMIHPISLLLPHPSFLIACYMATPTISFTSRSKA